MTATYSNINKPSAASYTNETIPSLGAVQWQDATDTWASATYTWASTGGQWANITKS